MATWPPRRDPQASTSSPVASGFPRVMGQETEDHPGLFSTRRGWQTAPRAAQPAWLSRGSRPGPARPSSEPRPRARGGRQRPRPAQSARGHCGGDRPYHCGTRRSALAMTHTDPAPFCWELCNFLELSRRQCQATLADANSCAAGSTCSLTKGCPLTFQLRGEVLENHSGRGSLCPVGSLCPLRGLGRGRLQGL